jgi:protein SCO1/2/putative membrane protein
MNKFCIAVVALCFLWGSASARASGGGLFTAPEFRLTDQEGRTVTKTDMKGKVWLVDFIFTRCGGACPVMTQRMIELASKVKAPNVRFVGISVDPSYDTPAVFKEYAQRQGATDPRFIFLTGDVNGIYDLAQKGFHLAAAPAREGKPIVHDEHILLIDQEGEVRGAYMSDDPEAMTHLAADATTLSKPAPTGWIVKFPAINASLNATSGILICLAMMLIQAKMVRTHATVMVLAVITSAAFLTCYVIFHYLKLQAGSATTRFPESPWRPVYLVILISHTILAVVIVPMIILTLVRAWRRDWVRHRRIARPTFWIWLYVSATGVVVYFMLRFAGAYGHGASLGVG